MWVSVGFECVGFWQRTVVNGAITLDNWEISDLEMLLKSADSVDLSGSIGNGFKSQTLKP